MGPVAVTPAAPAAPAPPAVAPPPAPAPAAVVTVQEGQSLWTIAEQLYGSGADWELLANANLGHVMNDGLRFTDPNLIYPGWQLSAPALDTPAATPAPPPAPPPASVVPPAPAPTPAIHAPPLAAPTTTPAATAQSGTGARRGDDALDDDAGRGPGNRPGAGSAQRAGGRRGRCPPRPPEHHDESTDPRVAAHRGSWPQPVAARAGRAGHRGPVRRGPGPPGPVEPALGAPRTPPGPGDADAERRGRGGGGRRGALRAAAGADDARVGTRTPDAHDRTRPGRRAADSGWCGSGPTDWP